MRLLSGMLAPFVTMIVTAVAADALRRRATRRRWQALRAGDRVRVPAKLRLVDAIGLERRWREGVILAEHGRVIFRPRLPRVGPHLDLTGSRLTGKRARQRGESWWFWSANVLTADGPSGRFELGARSSGDLAQLAHVLTPD